MANTRKQIKIFCTLGPSSLSEGIVRKLDMLGVDMFRVNLSHTDDKDILPVIKKIQGYTDKPICLDTEGAQVRVGRVDNDRIHLAENEIIEITPDKIVGNNSIISFTPGFSISQIAPGDLVSIDFDSVLLLMTEKIGGAIRARVINGGYVGSNKAVTVDRRMELPVISEKDALAIRIGLDCGIRNFALSFAGCRSDVESFKKLTGRRCHIISKIESRDGVKNLDGILAASDSILIDRGDLSREEPIEKIPFLQKLIIRKASGAGKPVYVATNLLESMVKSKVPTRAELNDIVNTVLDGASGLVLAAETAIGEYPVQCVSMVTKTIKQLERFTERTSLDELGRHESFLLVPPHGGKLVDRFAGPSIPVSAGKRESIRVDRSVLMDAEQIALGVFSPLEGFMTRRELQSVLDHYALPGGNVWPLPILLQVDEKSASIARSKKRVTLVSCEDGEAYAVLYPEDVYSYDIVKLALKTFGTTDAAHPGVKMLTGKGGYFIGGKIDLIKRLPSPSKDLEISPRQARTIFETRGWRLVVGFHTRNVIHRAHEHIQMLALKKYNCDGIFIHPVVGPKKPGDYSADIILKTYELMLDSFYPRGKAVLGAFSNYSRYAGPREAVFTALCRKNFGCSHFIVGRDHTGVGDYYKPYDVHKLFERLGNIGISPIFFQEMNYCRRCGDYTEGCSHEGDILKISGSRAREMFRSRKTPPAWFMRKEVSDFILRRMDKGGEVFIK